MPSFAGEFAATGTPGEVYRFLVDPNRLVRCLPDLKRHEVQDQEHFHVTLRVGLGRVRGPLNMKMEIAEKRESSFARILGKGSIVNSQIVMNGSFTLSEAADGSTRVSWTGNAKVGGYLMHLVGEALERLVQEHVERFVRALQSEMAGEAASG